MASQNWGLGTPTSNGANSCPVRNSNPNLFQANAIWRANTDPNYSLTVDASQLTVKDIGNSLGVVQGADWLVYGTVNLAQDQQGNIIIQPNMYDFEQHGSFWDAPVRNFETYGGFWFGSYGGLSVGTDYQINFSGSPNVTK